jgi:hypothetical protein
LAFRGEGLASPLLLVHLDLDMQPSLGQLNPHPELELLLKLGQMQLQVLVLLKPPMLLGLKLRLANLLLMDH